MTNAAITNSLRDTIAKMQAKSKEQAKTWVRADERTLAEARAKQSADEAARLQKKAAEEAAKKREKQRDLFERRFKVLAESLPWITQPKAKLETLDNYECTRPEQTRAVHICRMFATRLLDRVINQQNAAAGILLVGKCGTGKTHLAKGILAELRAQRMPGFFIPAIELFDLYTPEFADDLTITRTKLRELIAGVSCLVIDDVGADAWSTARRSRLQQVIDMRTNAGLPTVITSNMNPKSTKQDTGERLASRFLGYLYPIVCTWEDRRELYSVSRRTPEEVFNGGLKC